MASAAELALVERKFVSNFSVVVVGIQIHLNGMPSQADGNVEVTIVNEQSETVGTATAVYQADLSSYEIVLNTQQTAVPGLYLIYWDYEVGGTAQTKETYYEVGQPSPAYDSLPEGMKQVVENVYWRFADLYDSPLGGPHLCVDEATEALTQEGWKSGVDLMEGDLVLTLDHESGLASWQEVERVNRYSVTDEPMVAIESKVHSSLTTLAHRWPVMSRFKSTETATHEGPLACPECGATETRRGKFRSLRGVSYHLSRVHGIKRSLRMSRERQSSTKRAWRTSSDLADGDRIITAAPLGDLPSEPKWTDSLVEVVGWIWTEGHFSDQDMLRVCQSKKANPDKVLRIRRALTEMFGTPISGMHPSPKWSEADRSNDMAVWTLNVHATRFFKPFFSDVKNKVVSWDWLRSLTQSQLDLFIDVSIQADGYSSPTHTGLSQAHQGRLEAFEFACLLAGRTPRQRPIPNRGSKWATTLRPHNTVGVRKNPRRTTYTGTVWCPTVPNQTWLARREGTVWFTGNSVHVQTNFGRQRMAQALSAALGRINIWSQPHQTYSIDGSSGKEFPLAQWGGLLEQAAYVEVVKHLRRSYIEQPDLVGANLARLDRQQYINRWEALLRDEQAELNNLIDQFKIAHLGLGRPSVLVSGGAYGSWGPYRTIGGVAARPNLWRVF